MKKRKALAGDGEPLSADVARTGGLVLRDEMVAAVSAVVAGLYGTGGVWLLVQDEADGMLLPVAIQADAGLDLSGMAAAAAVARQGARRHRLFGLSILRRGLRLPSSGRVQPRFDAAVIEGDASWEATATEYPALRDEIAVIVESGPDGAIRLRTHLGAANTKAIAEALGRILRDRSDISVMKLAAAGAEPTFDFS